MSQQSQATPESKPKRQRVLTRRQQQRRDDAAAANEDDDNQDEHCYIGPRDDGLGDESGAALPPIPRAKFHYGDHTADIILHGYGSTPQETIETVTYSMLAYMFDHPERTAVNPLLTHTITVFGQDIPDLIFRFLTDILAQGVNYWDDLTNDVKNRLKSEPNYPGMVPRVVRVLSLTEESPIGVVNAKAGGRIDSNHLTTAGTLEDLDNNNNVDVQATSLDDTTQSTDVNNLNNTKVKGKVFKLLVEIQGDWLNVVKLGAGTEVKAITKELTRLQMLTDEEEIQEFGGKYHLQVLVDI